MPDSDENPSTFSEQEPYALTNMYFGPGHVREGKTMFGWVTGTAGWVYRCITEYIFGFKVKYGHIELSPCLPSEFKNITMRRTARDAVYNLTIQKPDAKLSKYDVFVDGQRIEGNTFPSFDEGSHEILVKYR